MAKDHSGAVVQCHLLATVHILASYSGSTVAGTVHLPSLVMSDSVTHVLMADLMKSHFIPTRLNDFVLEILEA